MSLNIKNERVHDLAREAARRTGKTQTSVIEAALEQFLTGLGADPDESDRQRRIEMANAISLGWHEHPGAAGDDRILSDHDLYDPETGLPA